MLPEIKCNLNYPQKDIFQQLSKRRLTLICRLAWEVRKEKYDCRYKRRKKQDWAFSKEELKGLFQNFKSLKYRTIFRIQYLLALRISETLTLKWENLDYQHNQATITNSKTKDPEPVYLPNEAILILKKWKYYAKESPWVFPQEIKGSHTTHTLADARFKEASRRGGLPEWAHPHCLRHTRLSQFYHYTKDWEQTRMFARHSSAKTTFDYYIHADKEEFKDNLAKFTQQQA